MTQFIWNETFITNIQEIDDQHRHFFDIINRLGCARGSAAEHSVLVDTFTELIEYMLVHFATEENLMELSRYPALEQHKELHGFFAHKVTELFRNYLQDKADISGATLVFMQDWLMNHIKSEDMKFKDYHNDTPCAGNIP
jgi:hemerythrin